MQMNSEVSYSLCKEGFFLMQNAFRLKADTLKDIKKSKFNNIFNRKNLDGSLIYSTERQQSTTKEKWCRKVTLCFRKFLLKHGILHNNKTTSIMVALHSNSGCKKQLEHCDTAHFNTFSNSDINDVPLACIIAIEPNTSMYIRSLHTNKEQKINMNIGDVFIFRGDVRHCGSDYKQENTRLHMYVDSKLFKRAKNKTFF
jgi:hypothetical protein